VANDARAYAEAWRQRRRRTTWRVALLDQSFLETAPDDDYPAPGTRGVRAIRTAHIGSFVSLLPGHVRIDDTLDLRHEGNRAPDARTERWVNARGGWAMGDPAAHDELHADIDVAWASAFLARLRAEDDDAQRALSDLTRCRNTRTRKPAIPRP
jgi:hypothetical protein